MQGVEFNLIRNESAHPTEDSTQALALSYIRVTVPIYQHPASCIRPYPICSFGEPGEKNLNVWYLCALGPNIVS